jgi:nucleotide-binding universal stress UspA family protein
MPPVDASFADPEIIRRSPPYRIQETEAMSDRRVSSMLGIKTILVHVEGVETDESVLGVASSLATRFGADLEAVFADVPPYVAFADRWLTADIVQTQRKLFRQRADAAKALVGKVDILGKPPQWTELETTMADAVVARGHYADLVVLAQRKEFATDYEVPAQAAISLGRPVLVIPNQGTFKDVGNRVLVAWNGTREAARAIIDALPFLVIAHSVTVLTVDRPKDTPAHEGDLAKWFGAHGVTPQFETAHSDNRSMGDVLLSTAAKLSSDLIVMGAYGRMRLRELILGGATHDILSRATIPVLISH